MNNCPTCGGPKSPDAKQCIQCRRANVWGDNNPNYKGEAAKWHKPAEQTRRMRAKYPEKWAARWAVAKAIRRGDLVRQPCEVCGNPDAQAHHEDYSQPLRVRWLCRLHHAQADRIQRGLPVQMGLWGAD
jgi:hypothetical protein